MKTKKSFLFCVLFVGIFSVSNAQAYLLDSCLMNLRIQKASYQENSHINNDFSWGFELFYDGLILGPSINGFKIERASLGFFEDSIYPKEESLTRMHIGIAGRLKSGHISIGFINEEMYERLQLSPFFSFYGESGRRGVFCGSDFVLLRKSNFLSKIRLYSLLQYFPKETPEWKKLEVDVSIGINIYNLDLKKISLSPITGIGTSAVFEQSYFYKAGIALSINRSPNKKMRHNFIEFSYQDNFLSHDFAGQNGLFTFSLNVDPYYLGIFKDLRK